MHSKKANETIRASVDSVRAIITEAHQKTDAEVKKYQVAISGLDQKYKAEFVNELTNTYRGTTKEIVEDIRADAVFQMDYHFERVRNTVSEWVAEPVPPSLTNLIESVQRNKLKLSHSEILALSQQAAGSYFGLRALESLAREQNLVFPAFRTLDELSRDLRIAQNLSETAVTHYCSTDAGGKLNTWLLPDPDNNVQLLFAARAAMFPDDKNSALETFADELLNVTDPGIALTPNEAERIAELFSGLDDEKKVERMADLLDSKNTSSEDMSSLKLFDKDLFEKALILRRDQSRQAERSIRDAVMAKMTEAKKAKTEAEEAAMKLNDLSE